MSPSNLMNLARNIESGRKKAANKLNARIQAIKATKGKTPTPVRLKEKFSFVNVKGKKREFVRKFAYDRALAKNKAEREKRTPQNVRNAMKFAGGTKKINNYVNGLSNDERNMLKKKICQP